MFELSKPRANSSLPKNKLPRLYKLSRLCSLPRLCKLPRFSIIPVLAFLLALSQPVAASADEPNPEHTIKTLLLAYADSLDQQDADAAEQALHTEARQFAITPNGLWAIGKEAYVGLLAEKKIGGVESQPTVTRLDIAGEAAAAILERPIAERGVLFTHYVQLLHIESTWKIVSVATGITQSKN